MSIGGSIVSEVLVIAAILLILYIIFKLGKVIIGLIVNVILGFIAIYIVNALFGIGIPWDWLVILITAILGLPGVALIIILKLLGISLWSLGSVVT